MFDTKPFSFTANCKNLEATIKKVSSVMSITSGPAFFFSSEKKRVYVIGMSGDTFARVALHDVKSDADGAFGFNAVDLCGLIKNRSDLTFTFNGQDYSFKQVKGSYKAQSQALPITNDQAASYENFVANKGKVAAVLPSDALALLKSGLSATNVKDVYQNTTLLSFITLDKKGVLSVSSFDSQHFGLFVLKSDIKGLQFKAALPANYFSMIDQIAAGVEAKFSLSSGKIHVDGKGFTIVMPATQADDSHFTMVQSFIEALSKPVFSCEYESAKLSTITDNLFTLYNANTSFVLSSKDGSNLSISFTTPSGTASDAMKVSSTKSKPFKSSVDPRLFKDVLVLSQNIKEPTLTVYDSVIAFQGTTTEEASLFVACARTE